MRRILFWLMIVILAFLAVVIVIATRDKQSPKQVIQSWFTANPAVVTTGDTITTGANTTADLTGEMTGDIDEGTTGDLSEEDMANVQNLLDSVIQP